MAYRARETKRPAGRAGLWRLAAATPAFGVGYGVANRFQLTHGRIAYRFAAGDAQGAVARRVRRPR